MDLPKRFGQYELVRKIASGGMAEIFLAKTAGIGGFEKLLVLKMIHPKWSRDSDFVSMLIEEAKLTVHLNHANIAQVFDLGKHDDTYYIAMEYVDGKDLFQLLVRTSEMDSYLPFDTTAYLVEQVAAALHYAHSRLDPKGNNLNLIHRDISPQNVIVSFNGEVKLIDFGIAKATMRDSHTQVGIIKGKFYYMSPEQAWGRPLDNRTDIFSLGICLHEMLTGQMLYAEENQLKLLDQVRKAANPRPSQLRPGVPTELEAIAMRALDPDPKERFQSAYEMQRALTEYLHRRSPGFTPQRVARLMWDLFPDSVPNAPSRQKAETDDKRPNTSMTRKEFAAAPPPDSIIFSLGDMADALGAPDDSTTSERVRRRANDSTREVRAALTPTPGPRREPTPPPGPRRSPSGDDEPFFTGDGHGAEYPSAHPPPPLPTGQQPPELPFHESTHIVDWKRYKERHPSRLNQMPASEPGSIDTSAPPVDMRDGSGFDDEGPTSLYDAAFLQQARAKASASAKPQHQAEGDSPMSIKEAAEYFETRNQAEIPDLPPTNDFPRGSAPKPPIARQMVENLDEIETMEGEAIEEIISASGPSPSLSRDEQIARAKAAAKANQDKLKSRIKKKGKKPRSKNDEDDSDKTTPAKKNTNPDNAESAADDKAAKIAAAKAAAQANQDKFKNRIKKKGKKPGGAKKTTAKSGDKDDDEVAKARAKARARAKKVKEPGAPKIVSDTKGNVKVARGGKARSAKEGGGKLVSIVTSKIFLGAVAMVFIMMFFGCLGVIKLATSLGDDGDGFGTIAVSSTPSGADIIYDGAPLGAVTPFDITDVPTDTFHSIRVEKKGFEAAEQTNISVEADKKRDIDFFLKPKPGRLVITSEPKDAEVVIDGEVRCRTDCEVDSLPRTVGAYLQVFLRKDGYKEEEINLQWQEGQFTIVVHQELNKE